LLGQFLESLIVFIDTKVSLKAINDDGIWLDPDTAEAAACRGTLLLAGLPSLGTITNLWQAGQMTSVDALQVSRFSWMIFSKFG
jgi:ribonuclease PH